MICQVVQGKVYYDYNYRVLPPVKSRISSGDSQDSQDGQLSLPQSLISWFLPSTTEADKKSDDFVIDYLDDLEERYLNASPFLFSLHLRHWFLL